ncbi:hypothetical protein LMH73_014425 [Vibrio splendidus]|nr:hypothetical protein [Vibrio splendidus]MCC4882510.1 hypothetical protein [Vibrio splendidus]
MKIIQLKLEKGWCFEDSVKVEINWDDTGGTSIAFFHLHFNAYTKKRMIVLSNHNFPFYYNPYRHPFAQTILSNWEMGKNYASLPHPEARLNEIKLDMKKQKAKLEQDKEADRQARLGQINRL